MFKKSPPLVTIYIPCNNYGKFLKQSVQSVLNQLYSNWELIIIDDGSNDNTFEIAQKFCSLYPKKIRLVKNKTALRLQKIANNILDLAKGKYMMRLDADDWLDETALLAMVAKLESKANLGLVYGNYFYTDSNGEVIGLERGYNTGKHEDKFFNHTPHGACTMFKVRSLKSAGGYLEDVNAQDGWDLWYKLNKRIGSAYLDIPIFYYRQHESAMSRDKKKLINARANIQNRINSKLEGNYQPTTVAFIPVQENYEGFKGVPYQKFKNQSLLERAILSATKSKKINKVIVCSQSKKVLDYSQDLENSGIVPKHIRLLRDKKKEPAKNFPIKNLMLRVANHYKLLEGKFPDIVAFLSLHAVNRSSKHIDNALSVMRINESDSVVSVLEEREPMFVNSENGLKLFNPGRFRELSYKNECLYKFNGTIIATWWDVLKEHHLFGENISYIEMTAEDSYQIKNKSMFKKSF
jgi:glycosyltransferase involved in cell wall biosynthesis